jgi:hypothetical protein
VTRCQCGKRENSKYEDPTKNGTGSHNHARHGAGGLRQLDRQANCPGAAHDPPRRPSSIGLSRQLYR